MDKGKHMDMIQDRINREMEALFPHGEGRASSARVKRLLESVAAVAFREGQAARWRECGLAPGARVEREGLRITGTITTDGRVALDEPVHGESHLRLTSAWRVA